MISTHDVSVHGVEATASEDRPCMVWVVIVTWNGEDWIGSALDSVASSSVNARAVVVDNGSSDQTVDRVQRDYPQVVCLPQGQNLGFGRANNIGIERAIREGASWVFLLNQDARLGERTLERLLAVGCSSADTAVLSPVQLDYQGDGLDEAFASGLGVSTDRAAGVAALHERVASGGGGGVLPVRYVAAALWLVRVAALRAVGGFDGVFFHYGEDVDLCGRLWASGWTVGVVPGAEGYHHHTLRSPEQWTVGQRVRLAFAQKARRLFESDGSKEGGAGVGLLVWCVWAVRLLVLSGLRLLVGRGQASGVAWKVGVEMFRRTGRVWYRLRRGPTRLVLDGSAEDR